MKITFAEKLMGSLAMLLIVFAAGMVFALREDPSASTSASAPGIKTPLPQKPAPLSTVIVADVPFTSQAPTFHWEDPVFQTGCEETSAIMAMHWAYGTPITPDEAAKEIADITAYETKEFGGFYYNLSAQDTAALMQNYYGYAGVAFVPNITTDDIISELVKGNLVLVPTDSQKLDNPHYTGRGSPTHMILIIGYDPFTKMFIANDPGTRAGDRYEYSKASLESSLRDYPTGSSETVTGTEKDMIVVQPEKSAEVLK